MNCHTGWRLLGVLSLVFLAMQACAPVAPITKKELSFAAHISEDAGQYYDRGKYADAEPLLRQALAIKERVLGPEHPDVEHAN